MTGRKRSVWSNALPSALAILAAALLLPAPAASADADEMPAEAGAALAESEAEAANHAKALFDAGKFLEAAEAAERMGGGSALAFAAGARTTYGQFVAPPAERQAHFETAMQLAERAVALEPGNAETHFELAHALGRYAQDFGILEALAEGFATRVRDSVEAGLALAPDDPTGHVLMGSWHAEILGSAGFLGGVIYGAESEAVFAHFEHAMAMNPDAPLVLLSYAQAMLKLDEAEYAAEIRARLAEALAVEPATALDRIVIRRVRALQESLGPVE